MVKYLVLRFSIYLVLWIRSRGPVWYPDPQCKFKMKKAPDALTPQEHTVENNVVQLKLLLLSKQAYPLLCLKSGKKNNNADNFVLC